MKKIPIPDDIKKYVFKKHSKKLILWLLSTLAIVAVTLFLGEKIFDGLDKRLLPIIYVILYIIPFFAMRIYTLFDSSWRGTIQKIEVYYTTESDRSFKPTVNTLYTQENVVFHIKAGNKIIKRKLNQSNKDNAGLVQYYREGDEVLHIFGTDHLQVINDKNKPNVCFVCGSLNKGDYETCNFCDHSLKINIEE